MKRTRILAAALLFLVLLLIGIACTQSRTFSYQPYEGELEDGQYVPNNFQQEAAIWLGVNNGQLYIWPRCSRSTSETEYNGWLCALTPEGIVKIRKLDRSDNTHLTAPTILMRKLLVLTVDSSIIGTFQITNFTATI